MAAIIHPVSGGNIAYQGAVVVQAPKGNFNQMGVAANYAHINRERAMPETSLTDISGYFRPYETRFTYVAQ